MARQASALERVLRPMEGDLPPKVAEYLLTLDFSAADARRYSLQSRNAQQGMLSVIQKHELDDLG